MNFFHGSETSNRKTSYTKVLFSSVSKFNFKGGSQLAKTTSESVSVNKALYGVGTAATFMIFPGGHERKSTNPPAP